MLILIKFTIYEMAFKQFTPNFRDVLTGTSRLDIFKVNNRRDTFTANQQFLDQIANYGLEDVIDLPGKWGTRGLGVRLKPLYKEGFALNYKRAEVIRPGFVGLIKNGSTYTLIANYGRPGIFSNEDIIIDIRSRAASVYVI